MIRRICIACLVSIVLWTATGPVAAASPGTQSTISTPQLIYKTYAGVGFTPNNSSINYTIDGSEIYATNSTGGNMSFILPLELPQGAQVFTVDYYVINESYDTDMDCMTGYNNPQDSNHWGSIGNLGTIPIRGSANIQKLTFTYGNTPFLTINNVTRFYFLQIDIGEAYHQKIVGAQVGYTQPSPAPSGAQTLTLGWYAFLPDSSLMKYAPTGHQVYLTQNDTNHSLAARLNLPIGALITGLTYYVIDNDAGFMTLGIGGTR